MFLTSIAGILSAGGLSVAADTPDAPDATFDFTAGALPSGTAHTRSAHGLQFNDSGAVVWGPHNLLTYSEELDNAAWNKLLLETGTVQAGPTTGLPEGATELWLLRDDGVTGSGRYGLIQNNIAVETLPVHLRYYAMKGPTDQTGSKRTQLRDFFNGFNMQPQWDIDAPFSVVSSSSCDNVQALIEGDWCGCDFEFLTPGAATDVDYGIYINQYANHAAAGDDIYVTGCGLSYAPAYNYDYQKASASAVYGARGNNTGLLVETAATQYIANGRDLSDWTDSSSIITASTGVFDLANSNGSRLTSNGANQIIEITPTISSTELTFACWVKGGTINDEVWFSPDGGTTQISMTPYLLSGTWELFEHTFTGANPNLEIKIVASGDSFDIDMVTLAEEPFAQMPIPTFGTATDRPADTLTITGLDTSSSYNAELTSTKIDGSDSYVESAVIASDGSGEYAFAWTNFPASDIREHRIVALLELDKV